MQAAVHHNWIDGRSAPAHFGDGFELKAPGSRTPIGRWPRSGARDLDAALEACERGIGAWNALTARERHGRLEQALDRWLDHRAGDAYALEALGCTEREIKVLRGAGLGRVGRFLRRGNEAPSELDPRARGANVVALDWSEAWGRAAYFTFGSLAQGRGLVMISDPRVPMIADRVAQTFHDLALGAVSVLHDDGRSIVRAAFEHAGVARLFLPSTSEAASELGARPELDGSTVIENGFGAGVEVTRDRKLCVRKLANESYVVSVERDLGAQAEEVVERAFGRLSALSGFAPGRIGRVLVPVRAFSRFTELLLDALEHDPDAGDPIALARAVARPHVEHAFALGHDEGATAIFTGFEDDDLTFPLVFTNVDARMKLARSARPTPVLCLMRVADESVARELAARIDV